MSVELVFGVAEIPETQYRAVVPRNVLIRFSTLCADMLEDVGSEEQSIVLPIPFVSNSEIARLLVSFLGDDLSLASQPPRSVFDLMMAANGMDMPLLLEKTTSEIARRWQGLSTKEIRAQWGFVDNLSADQQARISHENAILFPFKKDACNRKNLTQPQEEWDWPMEVLALVLDKLSTRELARVRAVSVECFDIVHYRLVPRYSFDVDVNNTRSQAATLSFTKRHGLFWIRDPSDINLVLELEHPSENGPRHLAIDFGIEISTEQIHSLKQLDELCHLEWKGNNYLYKEKMEVLASLSNLQYLVIGMKNDIGVEGAKALAALTNLQHLEIWDDNNIGTEGAKALATLADLQHLEIWAGNNICAEGAEALATLSNLTHLEIGANNDIGTKGVKALANLANLTHLVIESGNSIGREGAIFSSLLSNLKYLSIGEQNDIGEEGAKALARLSKLQHLIIGGKNNIGSKGVKLLKPLSCLQYLMIGPENGIGPKGARHLSNFVNLQVLEIQQTNKIGLENIRLLAQLPNLKQLVVWAHGNESDNPNFMFARQIQEMQQELHSLRPSVHFTIHTH